MFRLIDAICRKITHSYRWMKNLILQNSRIKLFYPWMEKSHPWMEKSHPWMEKNHPWMESSFVRKKSHPSFSSKDQK